MILIIDEGQKERTTLQQGDQCTWIKHHGTVFFSRAGGRLLIGDGPDDKHLIKPQNLVQFSAIVSMMADAAGLTAELESDSERTTVYAFK